MAGKKRVYSQKIRLIMDFFIIFLGTESFLIRYQ